MPTKGKKNPSKGPDRKRLMATITDQKCIQGLYLEARLLSSLSSNPQKQEMSEL